MSDKTDYHRGYTPELPAQGAGTVTSVALNMPAQFTVTGSPVTAAGTLNASWVSQTQRLFFASPNSRSGTPSFRAILATDLPDLSRQYQPYSSVLYDLALGTRNISFTNASVIRRTYTLPNVNATILTDASPVTVAQGGTGLTSLTTGNYLRAASSSTLQQRTPAQVRADIGAGTGNGTVTSVALSPPTGMSVGGSPVTGSGTLNLYWQNQFASRFLASPTTAGPPSFRSIVAGDLPWLGTAATYNVPASGDAASNEVVLGSDSRLGGGGGTPPGSSTQVIFNWGGAFAASSNMTFDGVLFKASEAQARLAEQVINANTTLSSSTVPNTNRVIKKTLTGNYTYTLSTSLGANGDTITIVNAASAGNITMTGSGVNLYINGILTSSFVIGPRRMHTFYRLASNQWIG